jgi:bifunctional DNA-binding transcriptional regulator/antitoxin component of YhaV-PrlF toxin-antitoxin module
MASLTVTPEGTLTVPRELVQDIGAKPGEQVPLERLPNGSAILKPFDVHASPEKTGRIEDFFGMLAGKTNVRLTIEEMNEAIREAAAEAGMTGLMPEVNGVTRTERKTGSKADRAGFLRGKTNGESLTIKEINEAIDKAASEDVMASLNR